MIATVTLNTAIDRILFVRSFRFGRRIIADSSVTTVGGKGTVVSTLLHRMGRETRAFGFIAGPSGHVMCALLDRSGVPYEFIEAEGDTRVNTVLVDTDMQSQTTIINESLRIDPERVDKIEALIREKAQTIRVWVLSGSLPPGSPPDLWARLVRIVQDSGGTAILDSSGEGLREGIQSRPFLIKPNHPELEELVGRSLPTLDHVREASESLLANGPEWIVTSMGDLGLVAVTRGAAYHAPALMRPVVSTSGAGDGVVAGIALCLEQGVEIPIALRMGIAVASSVVSQPGTSALDPSEVETGFREAKAEEME